MLDAGRLRQMDHHCPWVNNCVGIGNHKFFIQFISYVFALSVYSLVLVVSRLMACAKKPSMCEAPTSMLVVLLVVEVRPESPQRGTYRVLVGQPGTGFRSPLALAFGLHFTTSECCFATRAIRPDGRSLSGGPGGWFELLLDCFSFFLPITVKARLLIATIDRSSKRASEPRKRIREGSVFREP